MVFTCENTLIMETFVASLIDSDYYQPESEPQSISSGPVELLPDTTTGPAQKLPWNAFYESDDHCKGITTVNGHKSPLMPCLYLKKTTQEHTTNYY